MAVYFATHLGAGTSTIASAVSGRRIRIRRLIVSTATSGGIEFKQDIGGGSEARILPELQARSTGRALDFTFDGEIPQAAPGLSIGYESAIAGDHGIWVEYDVVD